MVFPSQSDPGEFKQPIQDYSGLRISPGVPDVHDAGREEADCVCLYAKIRKDTLHIPLRCVCICVFVYIHTYIFMYIHNVSTKQTNFVITVASVHSPNTHA